MRVSECVACEGFPCLDVRHDCYILPMVELQPEAVSIVMIAEAAPAQAADYFYGGAQALFCQTTLQAFQDAGVDVTGTEDLLQRGVYLTTAIKCGKTGYGIATATVKQCSLLLERELALFANARVIMCMGDFAIRGLNFVAQRQGLPRPVPAGSTYKIRGGQFSYRSARVLPSYLQAGPSFFIEKSKRKMIAEDIRLALSLASEPAN